jgi:hypothetical protein
LLLRLAKFQSLRVFHIAIQHHRAAMHPAQQTARFQLRQIAPYGHFGKLEFLRQLPRAALPARRQFRHDQFQPMVGKIVENTCKTVQHVEPFL